MRRRVSPASAAQAGKPKHARRLSPRAGFLLSMLGTAALYTLLAVSGRGCPLRAVTGIPCPGCGLTRAFLCLFHGDFSGALYYHPLFWAVPLPLLLLPKTGPFARRGVRTALRILLLLLIAAALILYLFRLLVWQDSAIYQPLFGWKA